MSSRPMKENRPSKAQAVLALAGTGLCLGAILCMSGDDAWENAGKNARLSLGSMLGLTPKSKKAKKSKYKSKTKAESTATKQHSLSAVRAGAAMDRESKSLFSALAHDCSSNVNAGYCPCIDSKNCSVNADDCGISRFSFIWEANGAGSSGGR